MMDERSELTGYALDYARQEERKRGELRTAAVVRWLFDEVILDQWHDSAHVMRETLEGIALVPQEVLAYLDKRIAAEEAGE